MRALGLRSRPVLSVGLLIAGLRTAVFGTRKAGFSAIGMLKSEDQGTLHGQFVGLVAADEFAPVMDPTHPFKHLVKAHHYIVTGHKSGNVVIV